MEQMRKYPSEFANPLLLCFDLLNRCNIGFFDENVPFALKYWRLGYMIPFVIIHYTTTTAYMIKTFFGPINASELAYMSSICLMQVQCFIKVLIVIPKKREISQLVTSLGTIWTVQNLSNTQINKKNNFLKKLKISHVVFYWASMMATFANTMTPLLSTLYHKLILNQDREYQLAFGSIFPYEPFKNWGIYLVTYIFQVYSAVRVVYFYIGTEFLLITLCAYLTTQFALLREDLLKIVPVGDDLNGTMKIEQGCAPITIKNFIQKHQILIQLAKELDNIFNQMIFIDLLFATVIICFFCFGATISHGVVDKVNNYVAILALMFPIYILCYYGDLLKTESEGIADCSYENLWYLGNTRYQKIISFIIMRSQRPCCLTSLEYTPITLNTFTKVVSTTWSYFSLATSVYSED